MIVPFFIQPTMVAFPQEKGQGHYFGYKNFVCPALTHENVPCNLSVHQPVVSLEGDDLQILTLI